MKLEFIPLDYSSFDFNGNNFIKMIGRTPQGKHICVIDSYEPNLWAVISNGLNNKQIDDIIEKIEKIKVSSSARTTYITKTEIQNKKFVGKDVKAIKVFITNHKDGHAVADKMNFKEIEKRRGYDIPLISKYIIEKNICPLKWQEVEGEILNNSPEFGSIDSYLDVDLCIRADKISEVKIQKEFEPKILAFDIEVNNLKLGAGEILMISLYGENFKKVLTWKKCDLKQDFVETFRDEAEMIEKFVENVKKYSPDILAGYYSDGFDLGYLKACAFKNKIKLNMGVDNSQPIFTRGIIPSGKISGIVHVDLFRFISSVYAQYLQSETLSLNEVAKELIGEKKYEFNFSKIKKMQEKDWKNFFEYNLQDSVLTYKLAKKLWYELSEFTKIIKEPIYDVSRDKMSSHVENYLLHNLDKFNEIPEKRPLHDEILKRRAREKYEGAFVVEPKPGLYENIAMFDFASMHASIIVSFNISATTLLEKKQKNCFESPEMKLNGKKEVFYFSSKEGFFPKLLGELVELRKKYKQEMKKKDLPILKARSNAYKLLISASYGYLGFFGARYYSIESAATTLSFVRKFTKDTMKNIEDKGYKVIYGDTDSIAFLTDKQNKEDILKLLEEINSNLPGIMELELEDLYKRGLFVAKRTVKTGAKKKYALINYDNKIKIRGFETVRRDWCNLARELQKNVINKVLKDGDEKNALKLVKEIIEKIKKREIEKEDLIIKTQLKKSMEDYKSISPHVIAAKKMEERGIPISQGMFVEYFISDNKKNKSLVREKVKLPDEEYNYDIKYYLENQVLPAIENILEVFGININEIIEGSKQVRLF